MTEEQKREYERFADIAASKGYNQMVCLAVGSIMLSSQDWKKTINDVITLAEECQSCEEFGHKLIEQF